ncbi:ash family protein [Erwinia tracheiphila]
MLPLKNFNVCPEILKKLLDGRKDGFNFSVADVFVIAFPRLIVIAHNAGIRNDVGEPIFIFVVTRFYSRINLPDNKFSLAVRGNLQYLFHKQFSGHNCFNVSFRNVDNDSNINSMLSMKATLDHLNSGRYTPVASESSAVGHENPQFRAHNRAYAVFARARHCHISTMVGRSGQFSGWPVSRIPGFSPLYVSPPMAVRSLSGALLTPESEADSMATILTLA